MIKHGLQLYLDENRLMFKQDDIVDDGFIEFIIKWDYINEKVNRLLYENVKDVVMAN